MSPLVSEMPRRLILVEEEVVELVGGEFFVSQEVGEESGVEVAGAERPPLVRGEGMGGVDGF